MTTPPSPERVTYCPYDQMPVADCNHADLHESYDALTEERDRLLREQRENTYHIDNARLRAALADLRELYGGMVNQFAHYFIRGGVDMVSSGCLSDLEGAFSYFKLPDPCTLADFRAALAGPGA